MGPGGRGQPPGSQQGQVVAGAARLGLSPAEGRDATLDTFVMQTFLAGSSSILTAGTVYAAWVKVAMTAGRSGGPVTGSPLEQRVGRNSRLDNDINTVVWPMLWRGITSKGYCICVGWQTWQIDSEDSIPIKWEKDAWIKRSAGSPTIDNKCMYAANRMPFKMLSVLRKYITACINLYLVVIRSKYITVNQYTSTTMWTDMFHNVPYNVLHRERKHGIWWFLQSYFINLTFHYMVWTGKGKTLLIGMLYTVTYTTDWVKQPWHASWCVVHYSC